MSLFGDIFLKNSGDNCFMSTSLFTVVATPTDVWEIKNPNTSKTGLILAIWLAIPSNVGAAGAADIAYLIKRSTAATGGTSSADGICAMDSANQGAQSMVVSSFTANPTVGTLVNKIKTCALHPHALLGSATNVAEGGVRIFTAPTVAQALELKANTTQAVVLNLNGVTPVAIGTPVKFGVTCLWKEV